MSDESRLPWLPYGRQLLDEADIEAVVSVLRGEWLTTGPLVAEFEAALASAAGVARAVAVSSGTAALHAAYAAAGVGPGAGIVTSPLTFVATASCALHLGAEVRFADVDPATGNIDADAAAAAIGVSTRVLVPVDYAGHPADYPRLRAVAAERDLVLIADAAHSLGATRDGRTVAQLADAAATSFHPVKPITSAEGGAVLTDRGDWARRVERFRNHGMVRDPEDLEERRADWYYEVQELGLNYRLPDVLCALGLSQLRKLGIFLERRREIARRYLAALSNVGALALPEVEDGVDSGWHLFVVRVPEASRRDPFFAALRARGLGVQVHYHPVHLHPLFRDLGHRAGSFPRAEDFVARAVSLPIFPGMTDEDVERVVSSVEEAASEVL